MCQCCLFHLSKTQDQTFFYMCQLENTALMLSPSMRLGGVYFDPYTLGSFSRVNLYNFFKVVLYPASNSCRKLNTFEKR
jgi:hypothetical protein